MVDTQNLEIESTQAVDHIDSKESSAAIARKMIASASAKYSAKATAIGASIALQCKEYGLEPENLRQALIIDNTNIDMLTNMANNAHDGSGAQHVHHLTTVDIRGMVNQNFDTAERFIGLDKRDLTKIINAYPRFKNFHDEVGYRAFADNVVRNAKTK